MRTDKLFLFAASLASVFLAGGIHAWAQNAALSGQVSSPTEPVMEGVLVGAQKAGSTVTTVVVRR